MSSSESSYQKVRPRKSRGQKAKAPCPTSRHGGARHSSSSSAVNSNRRLPGATAYLEGGTLQTTTKLTEHQDIETTRNRNSSGEDAPPNTRSQQVSPPLQHPRGKGSKPKAAKAPAAKKPAKPKAKSAPAKRKEGKKPPYTAQGASKQEPGNKRKRSRSFLQEDSENSNSSPIPIAAKKTKVEQRPARQSSAVNKIYSGQEYCSQACLCQVDAYDSTPGISYTVPIEVYANRSNEVTIEGEAWRPAIIEAAWFYNDADHNESLSTRSLHSGCWCELT